MRGRKGNRPRKAAFCLFGGDGSRSLSERDEIRLQVRIPAIVIKDFGGS
jgi:hypothetical protein